MGCMNHIAAHYFKHLDPELILIHLFSYFAITHIKVGMARLQFALFSGRYTFRTILMFNYCQISNNILLRTIMHHEIAGIGQ